MEKIFLDAGFSETKKYASFKSNLHVESSKTSILKSW